MTRREQFLIFAMRFHGLPYIWGGSNPKIGLDCSGLAQILLENLHLDPPGDQTADALMRFYINPENGRALELQSEINLGDLVFYGKNNKSTHVTTALGGGLMIEAGGGGSWCTSPEIARARGASIRVTNINRRTDILCVLRPHGLPW